MIHCANGAVDNRRVSDEVAGRSYPRIYQTSGRSDLRDFLIHAVEAAGGRLLYASAATRAPVYLSVEVGEDERLGLLCYPFRATGRVIKNRPNDEHRLQVRYGAEASWSADHALGFDEAGVDVTLVLGVHPDAGILIGLDPLLYDPLPMGISVEFKTGDVESTLSRGWHAWERVNRPGTRRAELRSRTGLETLIGFRPDRLLAYARLEREASTLGLDPVLRMRAVHAAAAGRRSPTARHLLENAFHLTSREILELIANRRRLATAVRGGVAEHHLLKTLQDDPSVRRVEPVDVDGPPDAEVTLNDGRTIRVECKNGEEHGYADGAGRVEVQKTRASKGDPASRYYKPDQFDVLAVCLWPEDGPPRFVYRAVSDLPRHPHFADRLAVMHRIDNEWSSRLIDAV